MPNLYRCFGLLCATVALLLEPQVIPDGPCWPKFYGVVAYAAEATPRLVIETGGHKAVIRELLFTADGRELLSVSDDKTIRVWSVSPSGRRASLARTIRGQIGAGREGMLFAAALSPADATGRQRWLAVGGYLAGARPEDRYAVRLHDYASGAVVALFPGHRNLISSLAFSPSGRWLASASKDNTIRLWDLSALQGARLTRSPLVLTGHKGLIYDLAWSPAGDRLASAAYDRTVGLWNTARLAQRQVVLVGRLKGHKGNVRTVAFHPEGSVLVSGGTDKVVRLWRARDGKRRGVFAKAAHKISALAFASDGQTLLAGNLSPPKPKRLTLFAYPSGKRQREFTGHTNLVLATAMHPRHHWIASGGGDQKEILLWHTGTGQVLSRLEGRGRTIWAVGFARDGGAISWGQTSRYTSDNDRGPLEHRFDLTELIQSAGGLPASDAIRTQARVGQLSLATKRGGPNNYPFQLHVQRRHKRLSTITRDKTNGYQHSAYTVTPDAQYVLSGGFNGILTLYTVEGSMRARLIGHTGEIKTVAVSADGRWALSGSVDQTLKLWSLAALPSSGSTDIRPTFTLFPAADGAWAAWTPEGFFAASDEGKGAELIGYSVNQGLDKIAKYVSVEQLYDHFYRPDLLLAALQGDPTHLWQQEGSQLNVEEVLAQGLPPHVNFITPAASTTVATRELEVQVRVTDQGGGIGKVVWKINGTTLGLDTDVKPRGLHLVGSAAPSTPVDTAITLAKTFTLTRGSNTIEVTAYNQDNNVISSPIALTVLVEEPPPPVVVARREPPQIVLLAPATNTTVTDPDIEVQAQITDQGDGIGQVVWQIDGVPLDDASPGGRRGFLPVAADILPASAKTLTVTNTFTLTPGTNTIALTAYDRHNEVASPTAVLTLQLEVPPPPVVTVRDQPPQVAFITPADNATVRQLDTAVQVRLTDQGGGIGKVVWTVNGTPLAVAPPVTQRGFVPVAAGTPSATEQTITVMQTLTLTSGLNTIELIAYNQYNDIASAAAVLTVTLAPRAVPPQVAFVTPAAHATVMQPDTDVQVRLTDRGGGIGKVVWTVNGTPMAVAPPVPQRGFVPVAEQTLTVTQTLTLRPGANTIELVAYNQDNDVASPPAVLALQFTLPPGLTSKLSPPAATPPRPVMHLIVVGVNRYRNETLRLKYAVPDGKALVASLEQAAAPLVQKMQVVELFDRQATLARLKDVFAEVSAHVTPDDIFVLYLAGHGITLDGKYHFIPQDLSSVSADVIRQSAITQDHLQDWLARIPARKSLVLLDTCESGSFARTGLEWMMQKTAIAKLSQAMGRVTIVAALDNQAALEGYKGHGVFTYVLLQALREADVRFGNRDGYTGLFELVQYVLDGVPKISLKAFGYKQDALVSLLSSTNFLVGMAPTAGP